MERVNIFDQISKNKRNSIILAAAMSLILFSLVYVASLIFGFLFLVVVSIAVVAYVFFTYSYGDQVVLKSVNAVPADEIKHRHYIDSVEGLAIAAGIPKPRAYVMESEEINAFATGKDPEHSSIAITTGALKNLKRDEIEGVVGHEISHIQNYDIKFATLIAVMIGLIAIISYMVIRSFRYGGFRSEKRGGGAILLVVLIAFILGIFAPILSRIIQAAVSRRREYLADASGAALTRYPDGLARALEKIEKINHGKMNVSESVSHLFFTDPNKSLLDDWHATHPPLEERIKALRAM